MMMFAGSWWEPRDVRRGMVAGQVTRVWRVAGGIGARPDDQPAPYLVGERYALLEKCRAEELDDGLDGVRYQIDGVFVPIANSEDAADDWCALREAGGGWTRRGWVGARAMPMWAARYAVIVEACVLERLQAATDADIRAAGARYVDLGGHWKGWTLDAQHFGDTPRDAFRVWWNGRNRVEDGGWTWEANPWVWKARVRLEAVAGMAEADDDEVPF